MLLDEPLNVNATHFVDLFRGKTSVKGSKKLNHEIIQSFRFGFKYKKD